MPKNKRPVPRQSAKPAGEDDELLSQALAELGLALAEADHVEPDDAAQLQSQRDEFNKLLRNALRKKQDEVLYGAVEVARDTDIGAYQYLREQIAEASATLVLRREGAPAMEVNAFAVPLFVHSQGGLKEGEGFQDGDAFAALVDSIKAHGLESKDAKVVLVSHAYDPEEAARITYCQLHEMARDAAASMSDKKLVAAPALEASIGGWAPTAFGADDKAFELRFLVGFALKREDDPFYKVPDDEAGADAYFEARMARYQAWTGQAGGLLKRCLAAKPDGLEIHFLYQDLFFGAREQGMAELAMLQMMAQLGPVVDQVTGALEAVVGPADAGHAMLLRVQLRDGAGAVLATADKPLDLAADLQDEVDDLCDALGTLGVAKVSVALRFDAQGQALEVQPYAQV